MNLTKNELTKRILGLVIIVGFAFMGIIACPSGGGDDDTPASGGTAMCTTTDDDTLVEVAAITVSAAATSTSGDDGIVTLTWTDPTADGFTGVEITGGTPALASPIIVAKGTQTATIMGLTVGEESEFKVRTMYGTNCSDADGERTVAATPRFFEAVTGLTATALTVATGPNDAGSVTLTWTDPTESGFTGVEISGGTPALASPMMVAKDTQTATITGLTPATVSTFIVKSRYGENSSANETARATTPKGAIALFNLGAQDGDFGFAACQTAIENTANSNLRDRGYTQARFFGSTNTYNFNAIATDTAALGVSGTDISGYTIATFTDLTGTTVPATTFGTGTPATRSLTNILTLSGGSTFNWSTANRAVIETVTGGPLSATNAVWVFSLPPTGTYSTAGDDNTTNCMGATVNTGAGGSFADGQPVATVVTCEGLLHVLCVAR